jgi:hypothetical protein
MRSQGNKEQTILRREKERKNIENHERSDKTDEKHGETERLCFSA